MKKIIYSTITVCLMTLFSFNASATNYTSTASGGNWNVGSTWSGGTGAPTNLTTDNITILSTATVKWNNDFICGNLTVNGNLQGLVANKTLTVNGNYTVASTGTESGTGQINFAGNGKILTIQGTIGFNVPKWNFANNTTIASPSVIIKNSFIIASGKTVTNQATVTITTVTAGSSSTWINSSGASLTINQSGFMAGQTFTANAAVNTVTTNYTSGALPTTSAGYYNLVVGGGAGTKTLPATTVIVKNLTINASNILSANTYNLSVGGNWTNNGTFTASVGKTVTFNGSAAQTIATSVGTQTFEGLTINNTSGGVQINSGTYLLNDVLTMTSGNFNVNGNSFTLVSDATKTARIAQITGGSISGNFIVQRYVSGRSANWADLASPVASTTFNDWASDLFAVSYSYSPPSSYPTQVTYSEPLDDFVYTISSGTTLTPGKGFEVYLSGDFSYGAFPATIMNVTGNPNQGDKNLSSLISFSGAGSNLVGNPFASSINWSNVISNIGTTHINSTYDVFDSGSGNYATYGAGTKIASGQGFWVYTNAASPTLVIPESAKTTTASFTIYKGVSEPYFKLKLSSNDMDNTFYHTLKINATNEASDSWDNTDHPYRKSPDKRAPSITCLIDSKKAVINSFNISNDSYSIPLYTTVATSGEYKIEADGFDNLSAYNCVKLEDKLLNKIIDLKIESSYSFKMNMSDNADRFIIHFNKDANCSIAMGVNNLSTNLSNNVEILPSAQGNTINFNLAETTNTTISVTNMLGQQIISDMNISATNQTVELFLPEGFTGLYIVKVNSEKSSFVKKFVRK